MEFLIRLTDETNIQAFCYNPVHKEEKQSRVYFEDATFAAPCPSCGTTTYVYCKNNAISKKGDIITWKPDGWSWGTMERKHFGILRYNCTDAQARDLAQTINDSVNENLAKQYQIDANIRYEYLKSVSQNYALSLQYDADTQARYDYLRSQSTNIILADKYKTDLNACYSNLVSAGKTDLEIKNSTEYVSILKNLMFYMKAFNDEIQTDSEFVNLKINYKNSIEAFNAEVLNDVVYSTTVQNQKNAEHKAQAAFRFRKYGFDFQTALKTADLKTWTDETKDSNIVTITNTIAFKVR